MQWEEKRLGFKKLKFGDILDKKIEHYLEINTIHICN